MARKIRLVVVENDTDEQYFMKEGFDTTGLFEVLAIVKNGDVLFEWLEKNKNNLPELVLTDLNMPGRNGMDIVEEMKRTAPYQNIPVIITSTSSTPSIIEQCLAKGAAAYMVKPDTFIDYVPFIKDLHTKALAMV